MEPTNQATTYDLHNRLCFCVYKNIHQTQSEKRYYQNGKEHQQQIQDVIWKHKQVMLIKVAAHLTEKKQTAIIVNDTADALVKLGSKKSKSQNISATPSLTHWDFSSCWSYDPLGCRSEPVLLWDDTG
eukprot:453741_1